MIQWLLFSLLITISVENKYFKNLNKAFIATVIIFLSLVVILSFRLNLSTEKILVSSFLSAIWILNSILLSFLVSGFLGARNNKLLLPNITPATFRISKSGWINLAILICAGVIVSISSGILHQ